MSIVIVGGGHAAGQAAATLRQEGYEGRVVVIGEEPHIPYQRPPLSKQYLAGEYGLERVYLRPAKFYESKNIEVRHGVRVQSIDAKAQTVACADGETVAYDKLLLATGARPRRLPVSGGSLPGVHYLRTIADVDAIKQDFQPGRRIAIVGGGYIGLEVAAVAVEMGLQATILEMEPRILQRVATPAMSAFYHELHAGKGVAIRTNARVDAFAGTNRLTAVVCTDGEQVQADLAIVGVGVVPNLELAQAAGLNCDDGIVVDEHARTSDEHIYGAGDCTNHPNPLLGRRVRLESVPNAMEQSRAAAANMAGNPRTYATMPWFWSDQYDLKLQMVGFPAEGDERVLRGDPAARQFANFYVRDGVLAAAEAVNSAREFMAARQLIGKPVQASHLEDPGTDLKTIVRSAA